MLDYKSLLAVFSFFLAIAPAGMGITKSVRKHVLLTDFVIDYVARGNLNIRVAALQLTSNIFFSWYLLCQRGEYDAEHNYCTLMLSSEY